MYVFLQFFLYTSIPDLFTPVGPSDSLICPCVLGKSTFFILLILKISPLSPHPSHIEAFYQEILVLIWSIQMCFHAIAALYILHVEFCLSDNISCLIIAIFACEVIIMPCLNCPKYAYETTWSYRCNLFLVHWFLFQFLSSLCPLLHLTPCSFSTNVKCMHFYWTLSHLFLIWRSFISSPLCFFLCKTFSCILCVLWIFLFLDIIAFSDVWFCRDARLYLKYRISYQILDFSFSITFIWKPKLSHLWWCMSLFSLSTLRWFGLLWVLNSFSDFHGKWGVMVN